MKRSLALLLLGWAASAAAQTPPEIHFVPIHPGASDSITVLVEGNGCARFLGRVQTSGSRTILRAELIPDPAPCTSQPWGFTYQLGRLQPGRHVVAVEMDDELTVEREVVVSAPEPDEAVLFLQAGLLASEFSVLLDWSFSGETVMHRANAVSVSPQAGYFWFFSPDNPEVTVKILDGSRVNGRGWLFISSLTTLPFMLTLESCAPNVSPPLCKTYKYRYPGGRGRLIVDRQIE